MDTRTLPLRLEDVTRAQLLEARSLDYVKWLSCLSIAKVPDAASRLYLERWPTSIGASAVKKSLDTLELKAAVPPGSSTGADWGAPLVGVQALVSGFAAIARSASLLGRIPGVRSIPFKTKVPIETQGANYVWIGENSNKPVTKLGFSNGVTLDPTKAVGIIAISAELAQLTAPGTDTALRDTLVAGLTAFTDKSLLDPLSTAIVGQRPASITAGLTPVANTGNLQTDVASLLAAFFTARPGAQEPALIANAAKAAQLRALNPGFGLPILSTEAAGATVVVVDGSGIFVADDGVRIDISREASIELVDNPVAATAATVQSSLWQLNLVGYKVERFLNFFAVPTSVAYLAA